MTWGNDSILWYHPPGFDKLGLAVPNWGVNAKTQNGEILELVTLLGRTTQMVMFSPDARLTSPPTPNTVQDIAALCERFFQLASSHLIPEGTGVQAPEAPHLVADFEPFVVYPAPYFKVRSPWLKKFAYFSLLAMGELIQSGENGRPLYLSQALVGRCTVFVHQVYSRLAIDLLRVPILDMVKDANQVPQYVPEDPRSLRFRLTLAQKASYAPSTWFTDMELVSTAPPEEEVPTEVDIRPLAEGIPLTMITTDVDPWPYGPAAVAGANKAATVPAGTGVGPASLPAAPGSLQAASDQQTAAGG